MEALTELAVGWLRGASGFNTWHIKQAGAWPAGWGPAGEGRVRAAASHQEQDMFPAFRASSRCITAVAWEVPVTSPSGQRGN